MPENLQIDNDDDDDDDDDDYDDGPNDDLEVQSTDELRRTSDKKFIIRSSFDT